MGRLTEWGLPPCGVLLTATCPLAPHTVRASQHYLPWCTNLAGLPPAVLQWMAPSTCSASERYNLYEVPMMQFETSAGTALSSMVGSCTSACSAWICPCLPRQHDAQWLLIDPVTTALAHATQPHGTPPRPRQHPCPAHHRLAGPHCRLCGCAAHSDAATAELQLQRQPRATGHLPAHSLVGRVGLSRCVPEKTGCVCCGTEAELLQQSNLPAGRLQLAGCSANALLLLF